MLVLAQSTFLSKMSMPVELLRRGALACPVYSRATQRSHGRSRSQKRAQENDEEGGRDSEIRSTLELQLRVCRRVLKHGVFNHPVCRLRLSVHVPRGIREKVLIHRGVTHPHRSWLPSKERKHCGLNVAPNHLENRHQWWRGWSRETRS